ncbi:alkaline phosphatase family protein [Halorarum halophilum]|uniref:Alkaline phosphatase family protein n=1 Tax=Halorarum halophilum TaxID=2743090 RepID=A0A7D5GK41_9EURY|nr:alkaline phosphatase family protein [Halobaculum halophilum]QLG27204.1 alkaline phosphatase family protein [Halobaculum halophilum]
MTRTQNAVVIGLDGVPWNLVERWSEAGELPTFARLIEEGAAGGLESTTPASTPLAWPSIATGTWPDKHGLYWFRGLEGDYTHRMNTSHDLTQPTLWEMLDSAVVGNVPMTYPAKEIDGRLVTGMMTASRDEGFTHPSALATEIEERIPEYEVGLDWSEYGDDPAEFVDELDGMVDARVDLMELPMEEGDPRLFFFVYTAPDRLQHLVWDEDVLLDHYRRLDDALATALDYADRRSANLFVVSDHGFGEVSTIVAVNRILERKGYLTRRENTGTRGLLERVGLTKRSVRSWIDRMGIDEDQLIESVPQAFVDMASLQIPGERALYDVNYEETTAFVHGEGCLYVNDTERFESGTVEPESVPRVKRELRELLSSVEDPDTGTAVLEVHDGDDLFPGDDGSPDLIVEADDGYEVQTPLTDEEFYSTGAKAASHRSEGILLARGPDVEPGSVPDGATVVDVAPTILHLCGEPIPAATDGRVLSEIVASDSPAADAQIETRRYSGAEAGIDPDSDVESVERRLQGLGYIE